jgi:hypothetical protein
MLTRAETKHRQANCIIGSGGHAEWRAVIEDMPTPAEDGYSRKANIFAAGVGMAP